MIVGGYSLDLYCMREKDCARIGPRENRHGTANYAGVNERQTMRQARHHGWKFMGDDVLCPWCVKADKSRPQKGTS